MYNIKEAALRSGVSIPTLRAWERRYGVVRPTRTGSGYRLYDDRDIARLRRMRALLAVGWRPREAAHEVLREASAIAPTESLDEEMVGSPRGALSDLADQLVQAAAVFDGAGVAGALDEAFARVSFEAALEEVVFPALREIGERWEAGQLSVGAEHAAAYEIQRRLAVLYEAARPPATRPDAVVGLPPGARHEIGAFAFCISLRRRGADTLYLGADVPVESWLRTAAEARAIVAVLGVPRSDDVAAANDVVAALRSRLPQVTCAVGGAAAGELDQAEAVLRLPDPVGKAALVVSRLIAAAPR